MTTCPTCGETLADPGRPCPRCVEPTVSMPPPARRVNATQVAPQGPPSLGWRVFAPGVRIGPYTLQHRIGEGGMSAVYAARDELLGREVALKVLQPNLTGDPGMRRRFLREGRIARLFTHPNVVPVYDVVEEGELVALVLERVIGRTLQEFLAKWQGTVPLAVVAEVADGILAGIGAAHAHGVVHRDLKPGNVIVEERDGNLVPRVIDFGIARILEGTTYTLSGAVLGTCRYMSPEQVQSRPVDARADLYAFGVLLFELVTGRVPFPDPVPYALMMAHVQQPPPLLRTLRPDAPEALEALVGELLAKSPDDRPPSAERVRERLREALAWAPAPRVEAREGAQPNGHLLLRVSEGPFAMGTERRQVWLDRFAIDRFPVTNRQFHAFLVATGYRPDEPHGFLRHWPSPAAGPRDEQRDHPVVNVSHADARAYVGWLGLRLPSEAEWEKAARGTDGRRFPWGAESPTPEHARFGSKRGTAPVGERPLGRSPYGVEELAGQVWEWTADEDHPTFTREGPTTNPRRPVGPHSTIAAVRGGSWLFDDPKALRTTSRAGFPLGTRMDTLGFRVAG